MDPEVSVRGEERELDCFWPRNFIAVVRNRVRFAVVEISELEPLEGFLEVFVGRLLAAAPATIARSAIPTDIRGDLAEGDRVVLSESRKPVP